MTRADVWVKLGAASVMAAVASCSSDGARRENTPAETSEGAEAFANEAFTVVGAGETLVEPEQDESVTVVSTGSESEVVTFRAGDTLTVSIPFEAPNGNVVGAGIRFGDEGPITTVPLSSFEGATSGTMTFEVQIPDDICDELGSICHSILCYEFAVTDAGMVSAANIQSMASTCGDCTEPSCVGLLDGCEAPPIDVPADYCPAPDAEELYRSSESGQGLAVDESFLYFGRGEEIVRLDKDGTGDPEALVPEAGVARYFLLDGDVLYYQSSLGLYSVPKTGGEPSRLATSVGYFVSDGQSLFASSSSVICLTSSDIKRIEPDGTETLLVEEGPCVQDLAVDDSYLYLLTEVGEDEYRVMRMEKSGGTPEALGSAGPLTGPLLASDTHLYFQHTEGLTVSTLHRMPKSGGAVEAFDMDRYFAGGAVLDGSDRTVYFNDLRYYGCLRHIDGEGNVSAIGANAWFDSALATDETHIYALSLTEDLDYVLLRAPKP